MPAFFIADIRINDPEGYQAYLAGFMEIFERHGGNLRVVSSAPVEVIEGTWTPSGLVVLEFPTLAQAKAWWEEHQGLFATVAGVITAVFLPALAMAGYQALVNAGKSNRSSSVAVR